MSCVIGVVDPADNADLQQITIQVAGEAENRDPVISSQPSTSATQASPYIYNIIASDADGDELVYTLVAGPPGARIQSRGPINGVPVNPQGSAGQDLSLRFVSATQRRGDESGVECQCGPMASQSAADHYQYAGISGSPGVVYQYQVRAFDLEREELIMS